MTKDRLLSEAVKLLDETQDALRRLKVSKRSRGSARELSVKVRIVRDLLDEERARPDTNRWIAVVLIRETAKLVVELLIDNLQ